MTAQDCERKERLDLALAEGDELNNDDACFVAEHLASCDSCRLESEVVASLRFRAGDAPHFPLDELSRARIIEQVLDEVDAPSAANVEIADETPRWRSVAIAAG